MPSQAEPMMHFSDVRRTRKPTQLNEASAGGSALQQAAPPKEKRNVERKWTRGSVASRGPGICGDHYWAFADIKAMGHALQQP
ncbi:hypothetical protein VTJ04DRAFT_3327 [Mycothermus thermophilus]|uniref:uncharacterized protein n=1 Tax=Humicola insolens TaxID=85995 RepID=UPI0037422193